MQNGPSRSALEGTVAEYDVETGDFAADLRAFLANHSRDLLGILQRELDANV